MSEKTGDRQDAPDRQDLSPMVGVDASAGGVAARHR